jgi:hypothetical protein
MKNYKCFIALAHCTNPYKQIIAHQAFSAYEKQYVKKLAPTRGSVIKANHHAEASLMVRSQTVVRHTYSHLITGY